LAADGRINTTFTFNQGSFDGELKRYQPTGFVVPNTGNAVWSMQFVWPIKAEYRIVYLDEGYQTTIIATFRTRPLKRPDPCNLFLPF
jgi:apolipoprotein D and lipocalin family protein